MQISKKKNGRNILILFFKLEILTLKQGSGFFGKRQELLFTENTTWGLGKGIVELLIVFLGIRFGSLLVCSCHSWSEKRLKQMLTEILVDTLIF